MALRKELAKALYMEETDLINSFLRTIRFINTVYMDEGVKARMMTHLNKLLFDTIKHSNIISRELMRMS
jgi:hypothetical protein